MAIHSQPGIVDQKVNTPPSAHGLLDNSPSIRFFDDVGFHDQSLSSAGLSHFFELPQTPGSQGYPSALPGQGFSQGSADAGTGAGHNRYFTFQIDHRIFWFAFKIYESTVTFIQNPAFFCQGKNDSLENFIEF
jgi:hypothetical protein